MRSDMRRPALLFLSVFVVGETPLFAQNPRPFEDFTPGACYWVRRLVESAALRDHPDTTAYNPAKDTVIALAKDSVRYCAANVAPPVPVTRLLDEARVQLLAGADSSAAASSRRYMASLADSSIERKAWALHLIVDDDARSRPRRINAAYDALAQLDKLGPKAARASVLAHMTMAEAGQVSWNDSAAAAEASLAIVKWRTLAPEAALDLVDNATQAFLTKAEIALRTRDGDAARAILDTALAMLPSVAIGPKRIVEATKRMYSIVGKKATPIVATYWFKGDSTTAHPGPGKVSIITQAYHDCGSQCRPRYRILGRLVDRFGNRGFEMINFTKTLGYYRDTAPVTPMDEAKYDSTYFFGTRGLPGMLAVYETKFRFLPDGRRRNEPTPQEVNYPLSSFVIVDRHGIIRYAAAGLDPVLEEPLAKLIERLLAE